LDIYAFAKASYMALWDENALVDPVLDEAVYPCFADHEAFCGI